MSNSNGSESSDRREPKICGSIYFDLKSKEGQELEPKVLTDYTFEIDAGDAESLLQDKAQVGDEYAQVRGEPQAEGKRDRVHSRPLQAKVLVRRRKSNGETSNGETPNATRAEPLEKGCEELSLECRALVCRSHGDRRLSVTVRVSDRSAKAAERKIKTWIKSEKSGPYVNRSGFTDLGRELFSYERTHADDDEKPSTAGMSLYKPSEKRSDTQPVAIADIVGQLHGDVFFPGQTDRGEAKAGPQADQLHGAVLIAGRTKSAKSLIARGLVHRFLTDRATYGSLVTLHGRRPHLVTCEDPIEAYFRNPIDELDGVAPLIDYTPRDKTERDYLELTQAFQDALRQTPACLFVGEARGPKDLRDLLEFAGTGHLVVTTMHAGSLSDVFADVFSATKAQTATDRGRVGQRILAVIHLQLVTVTHKDKSVSVVLPSLWRRSPASTAALVAAGIGSLAPHNPGVKNKNRYDCLGRQRFAEVLLLDAGGLQTRFMDEARQLDLRGV